MALTPNEALDVYYIMADVEDLMPGWLDKLEDALRYPDDGFKNELAWEVLEAMERVLARLHRVKREEE